MASKDLRRNALYSTTGCLGKITSAIFLPPSTQALLRRLGRGADWASADAIAIDGKTLRRSYQKKGAKAPIHMVSAFTTRQRLVLAQVKVAEKSNERGARSATTADSR